MKILIRGAWCDNKGAEAMLRTTIAEITARCRTVTWVVERAPRDSKRILDFAAEIRERCWGGGIYQFVRLCFCALLAPRLIPMILSSPAVCLMLHRLFGDCDVVLDASGFAYGDACGSDSVELPALIAQYMHARGRVTIFLPQAWGPFKTSQIQKDISRLTSIFTHLAVRDASSYAAFSFLPAPNQQCLHIVPDIAFLLPAATEISALSDDDRLFLQNSRNLVLVCPNMRIYDRVDGVDDNNHYVLFIQKLIRQLLYKGYAVVLSPHETYPVCDGRRDDNWLCGVIAKKVVDPRCRHFSYDLTSSEWKRVYACCRVVISSRFHALIGALSLGKPVVAIGWSHKYQELLRDAGIADFAFSYADVTQDEVLGAIERIERSFPMIEDQLQTYHVKTKAELGLYFDEVARLIQKGMV